MKTPSISIVTPTLNAAAVLGEYAAAIVEQNYPKNKLEIIIADGGSADETLPLLRQKFKGTSIKLKILPNPLKTGEAGKAVGLKAATGELVLFLDSDNIMVGKNWLKRMVEPFGDPAIVGAEPWQFVSRQSDGAMTRYTGALGMSDPLSYFLGNYDHLSVLSGRISGLPLAITDRGRYLTFPIDPSALPTIGANGAMLRRSLFAGFNNDYLFDIDALYEKARHNHGKRLDYAKVKIGLVHLFSGNFWGFIRKQYRRVADYRYFAAQGKRSYPWPGHAKRGLVTFLLASVTVVPIAAQTMKGAIRSRDWAFLYHFPACYATLIVYTFGTVKSKIAPAQASRAGWKQTK
ncbi:glycosyltransferase family 2 protein [Candidatus Berkelbacteria bacterium]|nr:glycosyltransferase family 2 protein [Candidatus Berkelbacteria bacterium]